MLQQPVVFATIASLPIATLKLPVVVTISALEPIAVLFTPVVLLHKAQAPMAVLLLPVAPLDKAFTPKAELPAPVFESNALQPRAVLAASVQPRTVPATVGVAGETGTAGVVQVRPNGQAPQATSAWPSVPTGRETGLLGASPVMIVPLAVMQEQGIPQEVGAVVTCHLMQGSIATFTGRVSVPVEV